MSEGKFSKPWQVTDKNYWVIYFTIHILHFMNDSNSRKNNLQGFENSQMIWGDVYELGQDS